MVYDRGMARREKTLPDGILDSPRLFLDAIRIGTGGHEFDKDAVLFLEKEFREACAKIGGLTIQLRKAAMLFWTGAYLGLRVANRAYAKRLEIIAHEARQAAQ